MTDVISSFGERLSADLLATALRARGLQATHRMPHKIGLITDGKFGDATANIQRARETFTFTSTPAQGRHDRFCAGIFRRQ
jgi:aspartokinase